MACADTPAEKGETKRPDECYAAIQHKVESWREVAKVVQYDGQGKNGDGGERNGEKLSKAMS
jgi:hypothetical protein